MLIWINYSCFGLGKPHNDVNHPDFVPNVFRGIISPKKNQIDGDFQVVTSSNPQITSGNVIYMHILRRYN